MNGSTLDENTHQQWDLGGKLIVKAQLNDDIRRIPIHNEDITYDELVLMMQRVFRGKLSTSDDIVLKYKDEDGDLVTIFDSSDLAFAIQCSRILKLTLLVNSDSQKSVLEVKTVKETADLQMLRKELAGIRDRVNSILDQLGSGPAPASRPDTPAQPEPEKLPAISIKPSPVHTKEFDPFQQNGKQDVDSSKIAAAFGMPEAADILPSAAPPMPSSAGLPAAQAPTAQPVPTQLPQPQQQHQQPSLPQQIPSQYPGFPQQQGLRPQGYAPTTSAPYSMAPSQPPMYPQPSFSPQQSNPQPQQQQQSQQPYGQGINYNSQGPAPSFSAPNQQQAYNPGPQTQQGPAQQGMAPNPASFNYQAYQAGAATPANPYQRPAQAPYASRPQPNYR